MNNDFLNPGSLWVGGEPEIGAILMPWSTIDPIHAGIEMMMMHRGGMNIFVPDFVMPVFELEPLYLGIDYNYPEANILKLRLIIRKQKQNAAIKTRRE